MKTWDGAASKHLDAVIDRLRDTGVIELLEENVATIWHRNVDEFDPQLGDTSRSLGITCHENIRELLVRECTGEASPWPGRGVKATAVESSLRIEACGIRLGQMKAPPSRSRTPDWDGNCFNWSQDSDVRQAAACRNSQAYQPTASDQADRQLSLALEDVPQENAALMQDLLLVWSGDLDTSLTAGWLGLPSLGKPAWFTVAPLWWHEGGTRVETPRSGDAPGGSDTFADRVVPTAAVTLKNRRDASRRPQ